MNDLSPLGKALLGLAAILAAVGGIMLLAGKVPWLGRLPGDIYVKRDRFTFYFPLATSILLSVIFSLLLYFLNRK